ncbi:MAG: hypothetical protein H6978_00335 [Gammaproteobacteria bacterium]|nr:hypothetical protein [Gammaproteobacteria bacterium]
MAKTGLAALGATLALVMVTLPPAVTAADRIKCWTNRDGIRECGNVVPPEYSQKGYEEKNLRGITVGTQNRALTNEELETRRQQAAEIAAQEREQARREANDRVLLATFASVDDILLARDGQIANIDSQIRVTRSHIEKLHANLGAMIARAAASERRGEQPSEEITANIDNVREQIADNESFIENKIAEQQSVKVQYNADIRRFRELKGLLPNPEFENSPPTTGATVPPSAQLAAP